MKSIGGLMATLQPNEALQLRGSDYIIQNCSPIPTRVRVFLKSKLIIALNEQNQNEQKVESDGLSKGK
jgi:hypothetical protein